MKFKNKVIIFCFVLVVFGIVFYPNIDALAEEWTDVQSVNVNTDISGNVVNGYGQEQNRYSFSLEKDGMVQICFKNPLQGSQNAFWNVSLFNEKYDEMLNSNIAGNKTETKLTRMGLSAGTYYIKINSSDRYSAPSTDAYIFNIIYEETSVWEKEFNETFQLATSVNTDVKYSGTIRGGYGSEKDLYIFSLQSAGCVSVLFENPLQPSKESYWKVRLYNGAYDEIKDWDIGGADISHELTKIGLSSGTYYVSVESTDRYSARSTDVYELTIGFTGSEYWEREFNEQYVSANPIALESEYHGTTHSGYGTEKDYYSVDITEKGIYRISFNTAKQGSSSSYWNICLYDSAYNEIDNYNILGNNTKSIKNETLKEGHYYILVQSADRYQAMSDAEYIVGIFPRPITSSEPEVSAEIPTPQIKNVYSLKKRLMIKWALPEGDFDGYIIRYARKLSMKGAKQLTVKNKTVTAKTIKGLKRNKRYYVYICTYKNNDGMLVRSEWSTIVSKKTK